MERRIRFIQFILGLREVVGDLMGWTWQKALWILAFRHFAGCWSLASGVIADSSKRQRRLSDGYSFAGFRAQAAVRGCLVRRTL